MHAKPYLSREESDEVQSNQPFKFLTFLVKLKFQIFGGHLVFFILCNFIDGNIFTDTQNLLVAS